MKAMIFAAGFGTRLRPLTDTMPKALVEVDGIPVLERVIVKLKAAGFDDIVVNVHHFASQIEDFLRRKDDFGVRISISEEPVEALETGGGIKHAAPLLQGSRFLAHNVDILSNADLGRFASCDDPSSLATLLLSRTDKAERCLYFDDDMMLAGWMNLRTGETRSPLPDFSPEKFHRCSFCGIQMLSPELLSMTASWPDRFSIMDLYLSAPVCRRVRGVVVPDLKFVDIGSPEKLALASSMVKRGEL